MRVLVTDANNRVALSVIRALARRGARIITCEQSSLAVKPPAGFYSRSVIQRAIVPDLRGDAPGFLRAVHDLAREADVFLPISTNVLLTVAKHREFFKDLSVQVPIPGYDAIMRANQKDKLIPFAAELGIPVPQSYERSEMARIHSPVVIKLRDDEGLYLEPSERYRIVRDASQIEPAWQELHRIKERPLIQEYIEGEGYGCSVFMGKGGEVLAAFCHRRIRELPSSGGPSTLCESVYDQELVDQSVKLLRALKWTGVAMVEFKKDRRDGKFKLMEINPRFWGAMPLAVACGVNFPDLLCRHALGESVTPVVTYPVGRRLRFFFMDLAAVLSACGGKKGCSYLGGFVRDLFDITIKDGIWDGSDAGAGIRYYLNKIL